MLKLLHCGNAYCTAGNSIVSVDSQGLPSLFWRLRSSLALTANGYPVVAYYDDTESDLKVLHCGDPNCSGVKPTPTATATPTDTPIPTPTVPPIGGAGVFPRASGTDASGDAAGVVGVALAASVAVAIALGGAAWHTGRRPR
jgi:hypothetical protein